MCMIQRLIKALLHRVTSGQKPHSTFNFFYFSYDYTWERFLKFSPEHNTGKKNQIQSQRNVKYDEHTAAQQTTHKLCAIKRRMVISLYLSLSHTHSLVHTNTHITHTLSCCHCCWISYVSPQTPIFSPASTSWSNSALTHNEMFSAKLPWHIQYKLNLLLGPIQATICWEAGFPKQSMTDTVNVAKL